MRLSAHITQVGIPGVVTQTGRICQLLGLLMALPVVVALIFRELVQAGVFAGVGGVLAGVGWLAARSRREDISFTDGLVITALSYLAAAVAGAVPFLPVAGFADAFFESMSGFTTTGLTVVPLDGMPSSLVFFRGYSQWIGGAGIVVLTLVILLRGTRPAHRLYHSEADQSQLLGSVRTTARAVLKVYLFLTAVAIVLLWAVGMSPFDAVVYGLATVSTGGFAPHADSLGHYPQTAVRVVILVVMLAGATSFPLFYRITTERLRRLPADPQLRALVAGSILAGGLMWLSAPGRGAMAATFHAVTSLTTTGFSTIPPTQWSPAARSLAVVLMVIGGSAGSTAGGIKLIRFLLMLRLGGWLIARTLLPEEARIPVRLRGIASSETDLLRMAAFLVIYLGILALSAVALSFTGATLGASLFETASALGTVGLSVGVAAPGLAVWAKMLLAVDMWVGRLEIVPVMVLLYPGVWRRP